MGYTISLAFISSSTRALHTELLVYAFHQFYKDFFQRTVFKNAVYKWNETKSSSFYWNMSQNVSHKPLLQSYMCTVQACFHSTYKPHRGIERASQTLIVNLNNPQIFYYPFWVLLSDLRNKTNSHYRMLENANHITKAAASLNPMVTPTEWTKRLTTNISMESGSRPHYYCTWLNTKLEFNKTEIC